MAIHTNYAIILWTIGKRFNKSVFVCEGMFSKRMVEIWLLFNFQTFTKVTHETSRLLLNSEDLSENYLLLCRNLIEATLKLILRCILDDISNAKYSFNNDNYNNHIELHQLPQALSQLTHVLLFDEEICATAVQVRLLKRKKFLKMLMWLVRVGNISSWNHFF